MKTVSKITLDGTLKLAAGKLSRLFWDRMFICYYQSKKDGKELSADERLCQIQNLSMDEIRRDAPEFAVLRTLSDAAGNEFKMGLGLTLDDKLKFYKDVASGIQAIEHMKDLPLADKLLLELADDRVAESYLYNFAASRLLLSNIRHQLAELHANHGRHFVPIAYKFFKQQDTKLMSLCLIEGETLHELELRQLSQDTYRIDFRVKDYRVASRGEYLENRGQKGYGVYLPVLRTFDEDPPIETEVMKTFAESKAYLLPRLAFMMEEHIGNSAEECIAEIKAQVNRLAKSEYNSATYFQKNIDGKIYEHFIVSDSNQSAGNLILVQKINPSPADKFVPKQKAAKNLRDALGNLQNSGDIKIQENVWLKARLPEIETFISKPIYRKCAGKTLLDRNMDYPAHEAADAISSLAKGRPQLVFCKKDNDFNYEGQKYLALFQGSITQMSRKNRLSQEALALPKSGDFYQSTLKNRLALKEAAVEIEREFGRQSFKLPEDHRFLNVNDMNSGLKPGDFITYLVPFGKPGEAYSGILALYSSVKAYCYGGGRALEVISSGEDIEIFQKRLRTFISGLTPAGEDHYVFFNGAKRYSASWGIEKALDDIKGVVYGFLPSEKDGLALLIPDEEPNQNVEQGFYMFSMDRGRVLVILDTTIPKASVKAETVDRYSYQSWEIQTDLHFEKDQLYRLKLAFILTHYKTSYLAPNLPLGAQTTVKLLKKLANIIEYPLNVARNSILLDSKADIKACENSKLGATFEEHLEEINRLRVNLGNAWIAAKERGDTEKMKQIEERGEPIKELRVFIEKFQKSKDSGKLEDTPGVKALKAFMTKQDLTRLPLGIFG